MTKVPGGLAVLLALVACGSPGRGGATPGPLAVVAAENFYGDIASQLGGSAVKVTSILSDPNADPHLFEPGTAAAAAVADARIVIENGLGYDAFMDRLLAASPNPARIVVTVADQIGLVDAGVNPHVWYAIPKLADIATGITVGLQRALPAQRAYFEQRLKSFTDSLSPLNAVVAAIRAAHAGAPVASTEPVAEYLLAAAGLSVKTPGDFAKSIEEGHDPSPQAVATMRALLTDRQVRVLLYNSQATSPITNQLRALAQHNGIAIVAVTETLPAGRTFQEWQLAQARALQAALA